MTRKFAIAAFAAALAASPMMVTEAEAQTRRSNSNLAIGIAAGVGGLLIGSAIANAQHRQYAQPRHVQDHGFGYDQPRFQHQPRYITNVSQRGPRFIDEQVCIQKPIERLDRFTGEFVTVGFKTLCR